MTKTYDNEMKIEFLSKSKNEAFARIAVAAFIAQLDPTVEEVADIKTAVSEAVTNAIIHGYEEKIGIVKLICKIAQNEVFIEISVFFSIFLFAKVSKLSPLFNNEIYYQYLFN